MRQLSLPAFDPIAVLDVCIGSVEDKNLNDKFTKNQSHFKQFYDDFATASALYDWCKLPRVSRGNDGTAIVGELTKGELKTLYNYHMVGAKSAGRAIYDQIKAAANDMCPFCGGLGHVNTLDHYLPKSNFPAYAVHPSNLVPCCRDCNTGKNASFGASRREQTIHPYLDDAKFFVQRWVRASLVRVDPVIVQYSCSPPSEWPLDDQDRVAHHFQGYQLAKRYSIQASAEVTRVIDARRNSLRHLPSDIYRGFLYDNAESGSFDLNGWSRSMYFALAESEWFAEVDFLQAGWAGG